MVYKPPMGFASRSEYNNDLAKRKGFRNWTEYQNHLANKRGFENRSQYQEDLLRKKGFDGHMDYQNHLIGKRGFESRSDYQDKMAKSRGFKNYSDYRNTVNGLDELIVPILGYGSFTPYEMSEIIEGWKGYKIAPKLVESHVRRKSEIFVTDDKSRVSMNRRSEVAGQMAKLLFQD